jgi:hypothetical protein
MLPAAFSVTSPRSSSRAVRLCVSLCAGCSWIRFIAPSSDDLQSPRPLRHLVASYACGLVNLEEAQHSHLRCCTIDVYLLFSTIRAESQDWATEGGKGLASLLPVVPNSYGHRVLISGVVVYWVWHNSLFYRFTETQSFSVFS